MARSGHWPRETATPFHVLQQELQRLLVQYVGPARFGDAEARPTDLEPSAWSPPVDVYETPGGSSLVRWWRNKCRALIRPRSTWPAAGNVLTLKGTKETRDLPEPQILVRERLFGAFHRQISLPKRGRFRSGRGDHRPRRTQDTAPQADCRQD